MTTVMMMMMMIIIIVVQLLGVFNNTTFLHDLTSIPGFTIGLNPVPKTTMQAEIHMLKIVTVFINVHDGREHFLFPVWKNSHILQVTLQFIYRV
jgi:hypothetical protein